MFFPVCTAGAHRHRFELIEITVYHVYTYYTIDREYKLFLFEKGSFEIKFA